MNSWGTAYYAILIIVLIVLIIFYKLVLSVKLFGKSLSGLNILVTGASSGIGKELCLHLAKEGSNIICVGTNSKALNDTKKAATKINCNIKAEAFTCDVTKYSDVQDLAKIVHEKFGYVDILISNAGIGIAGKILDFSEKEIRKTIDVNYLSQFWMVKAFLPGMIKRNKGHIVVTASALGKIGCASGIAYSSSKFALAGFMESLHYELQFYYPQSNIKLSTAYSFSVATRLVNPEVFDKSWMRSLKMCSSAKDAASDYIDGIRLELESFSLPRWKWFQLLLAAHDPISRNILWPRFLMGTFMKTATLHAGDNM